MRAISLKRVGDFAEKAPLLLGRIRICLDTAVSLLVPRRRQWLFRSTSEDARKEALRPAFLVASVMRLGAGDERDGVCLWTGRSCQPVRGLVELHVNNALRLAKRTNVGVLR